LKEPNGKDEPYVLDSSAFLAFFEDEKGAQTVQGILERARAGELIVLASFVSFTEIFYITFQEQGEKEAARRLGLMNKLSMTRVESFPELGITTGRLKALYRISFADAWIAATAMFYDAFLVHKDPEFGLLKEEVKLLTLPYKTKDGLP
jgi:uncharacterized protein